MKSALFVDFDNVYSGLRRLDPEIADRFAQQPMRWIDWLTRSLPAPPHAPPGAASSRRLLVRRCYLNPQAYQRFRPAFNRAGFEIIDCPPMTSEGKTSTDIHMVLDIVDLLLHEVHYDEFIVFSADADFTPVLRRLRRWDRRTTVLAIGFPSAAYQASADLLIDQDEFVRGGLGFDDADDAGDDSAADNVGAMDQRAEAAGSGQDDPAAARSFDPVALADLIRAEVERARRPVACGRIAQIAIAQCGPISADWGGKGTFRRFLEALDLRPLVIDWSTAGGYIALPGMPMPHAGAPDSRSHDVAADPYRPLLLQVSAAMGLPLMTSSEIGFLLDCLAADVAEHPFNLTQTGKRVRDRCRDAGYGISRSDVSFVLSGILLGGHYFGHGPDDAVSLGQKLIDNVLRLCLREQLVLDESQIAQLRAWATPASATR